MTILSEAIQALQAASDRVTVIDIFLYGGAEIARLRAEGRSPEEELRMTETLTMLGQLLVAQYPRPSDEEGDRMIKDICARVIQWKQEQND